MRLTEKNLKGIYGRVVGAMSGLSDIKVEINQGFVPHWNPTTKSIGMPPRISYAKTDEESFIFGRGIVVHEAGHVLFCPRVEKKDLIDEEFREWFNVFIDVNNEYKVGQLWNHLKKPLAEKTEVIVQRKPHLLKTDNPFMQVLMRTDKLAKLNPSFPEDINPIIEKFVIEVVREFNKKKIYRATGKKVIEFSKEVNKKFKTIKKKEEAKKERKAKNLNKKLGQAIKDNNRKEINKLREQLKDLAENKELFNDQIDEAMVSKSVPENEGENSEVSLEKLKRIIDEQQGKSDLKKGINRGWSKDGVDDHQEVIPLSLKPSNYDVYDVNDAYKQGKNINKVLKSKINLQSDYEIKQRSGRLDFNEVRKQISKSGRVTKNTIFKRENTFSRGGKYAIEVLMDCSGSMGGDKIAQARQSLAVLSYAFDGLPNIKFALTGFTYGSDINDINIKKFNERKTNFKRINSLRAGGGNADGYNIRGSAKRLLKFNDHKKLMIVISDGRPAYGDGIEHTKNVVKKCNFNKIDVIGVGIEGCKEEVLKEIYPINYLIEDIRTFDTDLARLIVGCLNGVDKRKLLRDRIEK